MELLKNQFFNPKFYDKLTAVTQSVYPKLDKSKFYLAITDNYKNLELLERMKLCSTALRTCLPEDYTTSLALVLEIAPDFKDFTGMLFPDFVMRYGLDNYALSIDALEELTPYFSSEFAIRPFLRKYPQETVAQMEQWSLHKNEHVRRLSSEGLRPILPWSFKLTDHLDYPTVSETILTRLNNDPSLYVRKSIGNHLNDLTKKHSDFVLNLIHSWDNSQKNTSWIIKKGLRTLIKNGDSRVFEFLGYPKPVDLEIKQFELGANEIALGGETHFSFELENKSNKETPVLIDYTIYYQRKNGQMNPKVFKLKEAVLGANEIFTVTKKISFKELSTRKHYAGAHKITVLVNGEEKATLDFILK